MVKFQEPVEEDFTFYCSSQHEKLITKMTKLGLKQLDFDFDFKGSQIISSNNN